MKTIAIGCLGVLLMSGVGLTAGPLELKDDADRINYSVGYQVGGDFLRQGWKLNPDILLQGVRDAATGTQPALSQDEMNATLVQMKKRLLADQFVSAKKADAAFLAENAKKEGVVILPSGVQYSVVKAGAGRHPTLGDSVTVRYKVSQIDGKPVQGGELTEPKTFPLKKALPGLQEALQRMQEGAIWRIVIPPGPALGTQGEALERAGVLVYELELVSVQPAG